MFVLKRAIRFPLRNCSTKPPNTEPPLSSPPEPEVKRSPLPPANGIRYNVCSERTRTPAYPWMETIPAAKQTMAQRMRHMDLAPPYPNPVPSVSSQRIADNEKAHQMLLYHPTVKSGGTPSSRGYCTSSSVGGDPEKCKKLKSPGKKTCPHMTLEGCDPPVVNVGCKRDPMQFECQKIKAPYPAYSELCHELPEKTLSECVVCPWKPEANPNFKPKKRHYHTGHAVMRCDLRKAPCQAPTGNSCEKRKQRQKEREKDNKPVDKPKTKKCTSPTLDLLDIAQYLVNHKQMMKDQATKKEKDKCKKFPFVPPEQEDAPKSKCPAASNECPPIKIKKRIVKDCPGDKKKKQCESVVDEEDEIIMCDSEDCDQKKSDKDKKQCPKVDLNIADLEELPCPPPQKENTRICPGNLLEKKKRPTKKTSATCHQPLELLILQ